ncbi:PD-(D/E)XK nuclease family protein [Azotobacter chroococcum]|uniref:PD-(D/E)XK nuclease superfamily protein n=1 Tax=Azotobacter chroococcum NCIMB 8003 TaxID=1328314 RepID=A0A0C4WL78_9GAMM|nr:PD-(D/E)XK nuclease family protein [Azotobacter chroococcum]AJE23553.1 Hypothetical protein Achr_d170 [Azotobacter chroococcum NCIMB 8003]
MNTVSLERLQGFFERLRNLSPGPQASPRPQLDPIHLSRFLDALRACSPEQLALDRSEPLLAAIDIPTLATFFDSLRTPLEHLRARGEFCNPWRVARLARDEVRNTAVLAWLLDPAGDHGLGDFLLAALLAWVHRRQEQIPCIPGDRVRVVREACLNNDGRNRVDIELRSRSPDGAFYVLIEAKIGAPEGAEQLARYARAAELAAGGLPWAIIYLTTDGRMSRTVADLHSSRILTLSWKELASVLLRSLERMPHTHPAFQGFSFRLAETFLRHVRTF